MMSSRLNLKARDVENGDVDAEDAYLNAENALINWGRWMRAIADPTPRESAKGSSLFSQMIQEYADDEREARIDPIIDEAELTERLILKTCSERDIDMFRAVYVFNMPKEKVLLYIRKCGHKYANRENYRRFLDSGLAKLNTIIETEWAIPSMMVVPKRNHSAERLAAAKAHQINTLRRVR